MGGRPRKPTRHLELIGAFKKDPARKRARALEPQPTPGLGDPPEHLDEAAKARWEELKTIVAEGVLTVQDRPSAEIVCVLWARFRRGELKSADLRLLGSLLGKFGLTPSERSKVAGLGAGQQKKANPFGALA